MTSTLTPTATPTATSTPATGTVEGLVWYDANRDGSAGPGAFGLPYVTLQLFRGGVLLVSAVTGAEGRYAFPPLQPTAYLVHEVQAAALRWSTTPDDVTVTLNNGQEAVVNVGDWNGVPAWLPLIVR